MNVEPNTPAGTTVRIHSSGKVGTLTGNQRWRNAGGMQRLAYEVQLLTGSTSWATFLEVIEPEAPEVEELDEPEAPEQDAPVQRCVVCGEDIASQWATPKCEARDETPVDFVQLGASAYEKGLMRAPALNGTVMSALSGLKVGDPEGARIMGDFTKGFDAAAERAAELALDG